MMTNHVMTPLEMMAELGLLDKLQELQNDKKTTVLEDFAARTNTFHPIHLGLTDVTIGRLLALLNKTPHLKPVRTGHIGNWEQIADGRARMMDFNKAICTRGFGSPMIYCFTQTENSDLTTGDSVYLPGSIFEQDERIKLPLYTWNGQEFVERSRENSYFTPFVMTKGEDGFVSLIQVHKQRLKKIEGMQFRFETSVVQEHEAEIKAMLAALIEEAGRQENARGRFQDLISHQVTLDGRMYRADLIFDGEGYQMGESSYANLTELVEAAMVPFLAVNKPDEFLRQIGSFPPSLPLMSNDVMRIFSSIFGTHYAEADMKNGQLTQPFNPHFHWGARDMGGYPPKKTGYFASTTKIKKYRWNCDKLLEKFPEIDPIVFVMMPAVVFSLCPADVHERDKELLSELFRRVKDETDHLTNLPKEMMLSIERVTLEWFAEAKSHLSTYWVSRFTPRIGIYDGGKVHDFSNPVEPDGFLELTFQQACMIVGVLMESDLT